MRDLSLVGSVSRCLRMAPGWARPEPEMQVMSPKWMAGNSTTRVSSTVSQVFWGWKLESGNQSEGSSSGTLMGDADVLTAKLTTRSLKSFLIVSQTVY